MSSPVLPDQVLMSRVKELPLLQVAAAATPPASSSARSSARSASSPALRANATAKVRGQEGAPRCSGVARRLDSWLNSGEHQTQIQSLKEEAKKECDASPEVAEDGPEEGQWTFEKWFNSLGFAKALAEKVEDTLWGAEATFGKNKLMWVFMRLLMQKDEGRDGRKELVRELLKHCDVLEMLVEVFWKGGEELANAGAASGRELSSKFVLDGGGYEMSYGTLTDFFGGLDQFVGPPNPKPTLKDAMEREHASEEQFTTGNYGITTTPKTEWLFATGGPSPPGGWPPEKEDKCPRERCRRAKPMEWLLEKMAWKNHLLRQHDAKLALIEPEVIGLRLYTGPMFQIYNRLLRALAHRRKCDHAGQELREMEAKADTLRGQEREEHRERVATCRKQCEELECVMKENFEGVSVDGHRYATTIHVINSGLVKLGKIQKAERVYRGLSGRILPAQFWEKNALGFCGGVENAFLSTTRDRQEALLYARRDEHAATVFEIQMGMVDRGADLEWVSQYPHEKELCFAPLTGLQVLATRVEGSTLVVEARLSVNFISLTIEEAIAKRLNVVKQLCEEFCDEVHNAVTQAEGEWGKVATIFKMNTGSQSWRYAVGQLRQSLADCMKGVTRRDAQDMNNSENFVKAQEMNNSENFVKAIRDAVDIKNKFDKPTPESIVPFLTPELTRFDIGEIGLSAFDVTDAFVRSVVERCAKLEHVGFANCLQLTDKAAMYIAIWCPNLQHAVFTACNGFTDKAVQYLGDGCTALRSIDFANCDQISKVDGLPAACTVVVRGDSEQPFGSTDDVESAGDFRSRMLCNYNHVEIQFGSTNDFFGGLERLIGAPDPNLLRAMEREHCGMRDSDEEFTTGNYGVTTTPKTEWHFATGAAEPPDDGWPAETKHCMDRHRRQPRSIGWLREQMSYVNAALRQHSVPAVSEEEAIGLRLYTGPMFQKYNMALRAIAHKRRCDAAKERMEQVSAAGEGAFHEARELYVKARELYEKLAAGMRRFEAVLESQNGYTTTIHVISAALLKLGRIEKALVVFRSLSGAILPSQFWQPDAWGICGGVEPGFLGTTADREVAMAYASSDPSRQGTVMEIRTGPVGRGADLRWVSQYPKECELCFPPLTMLQVLSTRVERSVLVVEVCATVNCTSLTLEEVVGRRHKVLVEVCEELCDEARTRKMQAGGEWEEVARCFPAVEDDGSAWPRRADDLRKRMSERIRADVMGRDPADMNDAGKFVAAVSAVARVAREFEKPTLKSIGCLEERLPSTEGLKDEDDLQRLVGGLPPPEDSPGEEAEAAQQSGELAPLLE